MTELEREALVKCCAAIVRLAEHIEQRIVDYSSASELRNIQADFNVLLDRFPPKESET